MDYPARRMSCSNLSSPEPSPGQEQTALRGGLGQSPGQLAFETVRGPFLSLTSHTVQPAHAEDLELADRCQMISTQASSISINLPSVDNQRAELTIDEQPRLPKTRSRRLKRQCFKPSHNGGKAYLTSRVYLLLARRITDNESVGFHWFSICVLQ